MFKIRCKYMLQLTNIILELDNQFTVISIVIPAKLKMRISDPPPPPQYSVLMSTNRKLTVESIAQIART